MADSNSRLETAKLGDRGSVKIPVEFLRQLGLEGREATLVFLLKGRRIVIFTEDEAAAVLAKET